MGDIYNSVEKEWTQTREDYLSKDTDEWKGYVIR
jgi:hypothetical protein